MEGRVNPGCCNNFVPLLGVQGSLSDKAFEYENILVGVSPALINYDRQSQPIIANPVLMPPFLPWICWPG